MIPFGSFLVGALLGVLLAMRLTREMADTQREHANTAMRDRDLAQARCDFYAKRADELRAVAVALQYEITIIKSGRHVAAMKGAATRRAKRAQQ